VLPSDGFAAKVLVQPDGKIVVAGVSTGQISQIAVARLDTGGQLDETFAPDGGDGDGKKVFSYVGQYEAIGVLIDHEGGIILPGKASAAGAGVIACAVRRAETCSPAARAAIA
jgi:beta-propeller uncharacterized protein DUF5122